MNKGRIIVTGIILSIIYIALEYVEHGILLKNMYIQTSTIWRTEADMNQLCWLMTIGEIIFAFMFGIIYANGYEARKNGLGQGFRFGILMGLLLGPIYGLSWYVVLPIPGMLATYWIIGMFVQMIVLGIVAGLVYKS